MVQTVQTKLGFVKSGKVNSLHKLDGYDCFAMIKTVQTNQLKLRFVKSGKVNILLRLDAYDCFEMVNIFF
jgi:hypothetical protein